MECSFCNRAEKQVSLLIAGPPPHCICDECAVAIAKGLLALGETTGSHEFTCSFCAGKTIGPVGAVMPREARICKSCTTICLGILEQQITDNEHIKVIDAYKQKFLSTQGTIEDYLSTIYETQIR
jgi:ATP-dependent protease Clp ATPase subunit